MSQGEFYAPSEVRRFYGEVVAAYQTAFAGEPWYEVSKCADDTRPYRCAGGLSPLAVGTECGMCGNTPGSTAYDGQELVDRFDALAGTRPTAWYLERAGDIALAAIAWEATAEVIAQEKYPDVLAMEEWLKQELGTQPFIWLDEVFADRSVRPNGNLRNFRFMIGGMARRLGRSVVAYRTIAGQMVKASQRDFGDAATVRRRQVEVPDRRDFVTIGIAVGGSK